MNKDRREALEDAAMTVEELYVRHQVEMEPSLYEDGFCDACIQAAVAIRRLKQYEAARWVITNDEGK